MLTLKEKWLSYAEQLCLPVRDTLPTGHRLEGLYVQAETGPFILMQKNLPDRKYVPALAEEIGHHYQSQGILLEQDSLDSIKSEGYGKAWAIEQLLPLCKFAFLSGLYGCTTIAEYAEHLNLEEAFVDSAIAYHRRKGCWPDSFDAIFKTLAKPNYREILYHKTSAASSRPRGR